MDSPACEESLEPVPVKMVLILKIIKSWLVDGFGVMLKVHIALNLDLIGCVAVFLFF